MGYCGKCGNELEDGAKFCPGCGESVVAAGATGTTNATGTEQNVGGASTSQSSGGQKDFSNVTDKLKEKFDKANDTEDTTSEYDPQDIANNKVLTIFSYLGILVLIPIFGAPNSKFARYHANQGIVLCILEVAYSIVTGIIRKIIYGMADAAYDTRIRHANSIFDYSEYTKAADALTATMNVTDFIIGIIGLPLLVLAIIGIVNVANGKAKQLPFIGNIKVLK